MRLGIALCSAVAIAGVGCESSRMGINVQPTISGEGAGPSALVGTDTRPPVTAATPPPPISGGTLLVTHDGSLAVASDPDRDRVSIVSVRNKTLVHTIALNAGDEPGRLTEDATGLVHVALRRGGAVVAIDPVTGSLLRRTPVCGAPRGIAYEPSTKLLHVACAAGDLVSLPAAGGDAVRHLHFAPDLRDVGVTPTGLVVSRFKSVSFVKLDGDGNVIQSVQTQRIGRATQKFTPPTTSPSGDIATPGTQIIEGMDPSVAWRMIASPTGDVLALHQYALAERIDIGEHPTNPNEPVSPPESQPYGAPPGSSCGGLVSPGVTTLGEDGQARMGAQIAGAVLAVDISASPDGAWVALAHAGTPYPLAAPSAFGATPPDQRPFDQQGEVTIIKVENTAGQDPQSTPNCVTRSEERRVGKKCR